MDSALIGLGFGALLFIASAAVNYSALRMADAPRSGARTFGVAFGGIGLLLMMLVLLWPVVSALQYVAGDASGIVRLFNPLLLGAALCTAGSVATLLLAARGQRP